MNNNTRIDQRHVDQKQTSLMALVLNFIKTLFKK